MALLGDYKIKIEVPHETETKIVSVTYPADIPEGDNNYDKRGTTVDEVQPVLVDASEIYANSYIRIQSITVYVSNVFNRTEDGSLASNGQAKNLHVSLRLYTNENVARADHDDFLKEVNEFIPSDSIDFESNLLSQVYTYFKSLDHLGTFIDC